ncbi:hypothetical protein A8709_15960 [Paenibacillus pectinilyticus]|uniref:SLH domain-containing protein n=1 Tax=Paenibacillus pectinilyticus TaxID=512399 RepID=A0A1C1A4S4_9BACL|nr:S-layer homology domain-containing protein [Paenibacillus pectinilyticus]OCT15567.1 hypothetical protein A8709_15960 [Paenibacillus pectinilyticus]
MALRKWLTCSFVLVFIVAVILPTAIWASGADSAGTFTMSISKQLPKLGESFEVVIDGHQLVDAYAFEINIDYDPTRLKFIDAKSDVPGFSVSPIVKDTHIQLAHTRVGQGKGLEGEQILFKLHFEAIQNGKSDLILNNVKVVDSKLVSATIQISARTALTVHDPFSFNDLDDFDWAVDAIQELASKGIVNGTGDRLFSPAAAVTRADFVVLLMRALGLKGTDGASFDDIQAGSYYEQPVAAARTLGIVQGDEGNQFHPTASITREDMMVLTDRALRASNHFSAATRPSALTDFNDVPAISDYAVESVAILVGMGLVHGYDNGLHPKETTNRAQAAVLIYNLLNDINK